MGEQCEYTVEKTLAPNVLKRIADSIIRLTYLSIQNLQVAEKCILIDGHITFYKTDTRLGIGVAVTKAIIL